MLLLDEGAMLPGSNHWTIAHARPAAPNKAEVLFGPAGLHPELVVGLIKTLAPSGEVSIKSDTSESISPRGGGVANV